MAVLESKQPIRNQLSSLTQLLDWLEVEILNARYDFHVSDNISILLTIANLRCSDFLVMTLQCTHRFLYSTDLAFLTKIGKKTLTRKSEKTEMLRVSAIELVSLRLWWNKFQTENNQLLSKLISKHAIWLQIRSVPHDQIISFDFLNNVQWTAK